MSATQSSKASSGDALGNAKNQTTEWEELEDKSTYSFATLEYLSRGKDGYGAFVGVPCIREADLCGILPIHVATYFSMLKICNLIRHAAREPNRKPQLHASVTHVAEKFMSLIDKHPSDIASISPKIDGRLVMVGSN